MDKKPESRGTSRSCNTWQALAKQRKALRVRAIRLRLMKRSASPGSGCQKGNDGNGDDGKERTPPIATSGPLKGERERGREREGGRESEREGEGERGGEGEREEEEHGKVVQFSSPRRTALPSWPRN